MKLRLKLIIALQILKFVLLYLQSYIAGGFLAQPASKYSFFQTSFFCQFPFVLPCLLAVFIVFVALIGKFGCVFF